MTSAHREAPGRNVAAKDVGDESTAAVEVHGLEKRYAGRSVVDGISFSVASGEIFALLGQNGAGKTTTVEMLEGLRRPDGGTIRVLGLDPLRDGASLRERIGAMPQQSGFYLTMTAREALELFTHYYANPADPDELLRSTGLEDADTVAYRRLSGGQRQRLSLALALVGRPELVFLDEPTSGMDPQARRTTWDIIRDLKRGGTTVLLTTHYLEEAERLADRVAIMQSGRLIALGAPGQLVGRNSGTVRVCLDRTVERGTLESLPSARALRDDGERCWRFETDDAPSLLVELTTVCRDEGLTPLSIRVGDGSLEEAFLRLIGDLPPA